MPPSRELGPVDDYWAGLLGCGVESLRAPGVHVVAHGGIKGFGGAWVFRRGDSCIVSLPEPMVAPMTPVFVQHRPDEIVARQALADIFRHPVSAIVGPSYIGCAGPADVRLRGADRARPLDKSDLGALSELLDACGSQDVDQQPIDLSGSTLFGAFNGRRLVAIGASLARTPGLAFIGVTTHPQFRGQGFGAIAASAAIRHAAKGGHVICWQADRANAPSVRLAESLGFTDYASHFVVRLKW